MIPSKYLTLIFVYLQGLSFLNPVYAVFLSILGSNVNKTIFGPLQLMLFVGFLVCQIIALVVNPHHLPVSGLASLLGLFAFTISPHQFWIFRSLKFGCRHFNAFLKGVLGLYFLESLFRLRYIKYNFVEWEDFELKEQVKGQLLLADDTNGLVVRILLLYSVCVSSGFLSNRRWLLRCTFFYLVLTCYSRAGILAILIAFFFEFDLIRLRIKRISFKPLIIGLLLIPALLSLSVFDEEITDNKYDSSVESKYVLVVGSVKHWWDFDVLSKIVGDGYFANTDIGEQMLSGNWASGHSIYYYLLIEYGLLGSVFLLCLIGSRVKSYGAKILVYNYCLIGLSVFRTDFLFLYITIAMLEAFERSKSDSSKKYS